MQNFESIRFRGEKVTGVGHMSFIKKCPQEYIKGELKKWVRQE